MLDGGHDAFSTPSGCLIGIEASATAHHWAREAVETETPDEADPPSYMKAYVKRGRTDAAEAEAICK